MTTTQLQDILAALREVEANLDRRDVRAEGAYLVTWGVAGALGMGFYRVTRPRAAEFEALLGPAYELGFLVPFALALVVTLAVGARYSRLAPERRRADAWAGVACVAIGIGLVVAGRALGRFEWIAAALVLLSVAIIAIRGRGRVGAAKRAALVVVATGAPLGLALFVLPYTLAYALAALYWALVWTATGAWLYARGG